MSSNATVIDLLRHGEPVGGRCFRGSRDDPLSYRGWKQLRHSARPHAPWQAIVSSPLRRCAEFASELSVELGVPASEWPDFQEIAFGEWEGCTVEELMEEQSEALQAFWQDPVASGPPGGERLDEFSERVMAAWAEFIAAHVGEHVLLVAHGGVIRVILAKCLGMPLANLYRIDVPYASMSRLHVYGSGEDARPMLVFHHPRLSRDRLG